MREFTLLRESLYLCLNVYLQFTTQKIVSKQSVTLAIPAFDQWSVTESRASASAGRKNSTSSKVVDDVVSIVSQDDAVLLSYNVKENPELPSLRPAVSVRDISELPRAKKSSASHSVKDVSALEVAARVRLSSDGGAANTAISLNSDFLSYSPDVDKTRSYQPRGHKLSAGGKRRSKSSAILPSPAASSLMYRTKSNTSACDAKSLKRSPSPAPSTSDLVKFESKDECRKTTDEGDQVVLVTEETALTPTPVPIAKSENTEEPSSRSSTILPSLAAGSLEYQIKSNSSVCDAKTLKRPPSPVPCTSDLVKIESKEERPKQNGGGDGAMSAFTPNRITIAKSENTVQPSISHDLVTKTFKKGNLPPSDPVPLPIYGGDKQDEVVKDRYALNTKTDDRHRMEGIFLMKSIHICYSQLRSFNRTPQLPRRDLLRAV